MPPPPLARLESVSAVPSELQPALSHLLTLHSQVDSALLRLDSCRSLAALTAATMEVKQRIAQLQQRIEAVQAEAEQLQTHSQQAGDEDERQRTQQLEHRRSTIAVMSRRSQLSSSLAGTPATALVTTSAAQAQSAARHSAVSLLLSQHSQLAAGYGVSLRQRLLSCRAQLSNRSAEVRRELLDSSTPSQSLPASAAAAERQLQFSASLQHMHSLLHSSLHLSAASLDSLSASTDSLRSTQRHSSVHAEAVKGGAKIITKQQQRQRTDRLLVWCGLAFFLLVCAYITNRRLRISRIIAFVTRTLLPNMQLYSGHSTQHQQQRQQYEQMQQWSEQHAGELQAG